MILKINQFVKQKLLGLNKLRQLFDGRLENNALSVLNMNRRNLEYIYPQNIRRDYPLADNKLNTKLLFADKNIAMADTHQVYSHFFQLKNLEKDLKGFEQFVIKPASGSGGGGILVIDKREDSGFRTINGRYYSLADIHKHIADILFGIYAFGLSDQALIEEKIEQHDSINLLSPKGLADIRIIISAHLPIQAMIRLATEKSNGTANLHQGAVGVGIDLQTGKTCNASYKGRFIDQHPDTGINLIAIQIPRWQETLLLANQVAINSPLKYLGVDIAVARQHPVLLEINVRPGIEIQNANASGMRKLLEFSQAKNNSNAYVGDSYV